MPLKVIDGTPTTISKFIREEEAKKKLCPECGSEMHRTTVQYPLGRFHGTYYSCPKPGCGHEERVKS